MGNELSRLRAASFRESRQLDGCTFTVNGGSTNYTGILSAGVDTKMLMAGGFMTDYERSLEYLPSEIALAIGNTITTGGKTYRVVSLNGDGEPIWTANLTGDDR